MSRPTVKDTLHPRNRFRDGYDFAQLVAAHPPLAPHVGPNRYGDTSIDFADAAAVKMLNQALLASAYGLTAWDVPPGALCPPIPSRSDYLHHLHDLLARDGGPAEGPGVAVLDLGTGASAIYPLIGVREYGWRFVATDIDAGALRWAQRMVAAHSDVASRVDCRLQAAPRECFAGVVRPGETFAASMCNPPFHASPEAAVEANARKRRNLGVWHHSEAPLNFGGSSAELWCPGGELGFISRMIAQSAAQPALCRWFTTLVARGEYLYRLYDRLEDAGVADVEVLDLRHGQKQSRILAWTFTRR